MRIETSRVHLEIMGQMRALPMSESARIEVDSLPARVTYNGDTYLSQILDISPQGLGIKMLDTVPPGSPLNIHVRLNDAPLLLTGMSRYCRELNDGLGSCRIGVQLQEPSRLVKARLARLIDDIQCAEPQAA